MKEEIINANYLKVKNDNDGKIYHVESQEYCDILWLRGDSGRAGHYVFSKHPEDNTVITFTMNETGEVFYFTILEYSFDYGITWTEVK
jgi:hypothetical protein